MTVVPTPGDIPSTTEKTPPKQKPPTSMAAQHTGRAALVPRTQGAAFITSRKGVCYLTIKIGRKNFPIMRIRSYTIDAQDKRDLRRLHPDIVFDWKKLARQLAEKREVCREYRSRRRRVRRPRLSHEPFYGVGDPLTRTVYVNDPTNITGVGALLDRMMADERLRGADTMADDRDGVLQADAPS
jgi:hypothetical protein